MFPLFLPNYHPQKHSVPVVILVIKTLPLLIIAPQTFCTFPFIALLLIFLELVIHHPPPTHCLLPSSAISNIFLHNHLCSYFYPSSKNCSSSLICRSHSIPTTFHIMCPIWNTNTALKNVILVIHVSRKQIS